MSSGLSRKCTTLHHGGAPKMWCTISLSNWDDGYFLPVGGKFLSKPMTKRSRTIAAARPQPTSSTTKIVPTTIAAPACAIPLLRKVVAESLHLLSSRFLCLHHC